jgi:hypothetical protein
MIKVECPVCGAKSSWVINGDCVYCNSCGNNGAEFSISELIEEKLKSHNSDYAKCENGKCPNACK